MTIQRVARGVSAGSLVLFPILIIVYWLLYPAYGLLDSGAMLHAIDGHATRTRIADIFVFTGVFASVPATLAIMHVLRDRSPKLAIIGGSMHLVGWIALVGVLVGDVIAVTMVERGSPAPAMVELFKNIMGSPAIIALNVVATLHVVGGILLGVALWRTRIVPRWAGIAATVAQPIHLASNIAGVLSIDVLTWIALSASFTCVAALVLRPSPSTSTDGGVSIDATVAPA